MAQQPVQVVQGLADGAPGGRAFELQDDRVVVSVDPEGVDAPRSVGGDGVLGGENGDIKDGRGVAHDETAQLGLGAKGPGDGPAAGTGAEREDAEVIHGRSEPRRCG